MKKMVLLSALLVFGLTVGQVFAADHFFLYGDKVIKVTDQDIKYGKLLQDGNTIKFRQPTQGKYGIVKNAVVVVSREGKVVKRGIEEAECRCVDSPTYVLWDTDRGPFPDERVEKACWAASPHRKEELGYKELKGVEAQKYMQKLLGK